MSIMAVIVLWALLWRIPTIVADFDGSPTTVCRLPTTFSLSWRHSVEKQYWQEVYTLDGNALVLSKTYVETFGAGVPVDGKPTPAPKGYVGQMVNRPISELNLMISNTMNAKLFATDLLHAHTTITPATANTSLILDTLVLPIHQPVGDYSELTISVAQLTAWQRQQLPMCFK